MNDETSMHQESSSELLVNLADCKVCSYPAKFDDTQATEREYQLLPQEAATAAIVPAETQEIVPVSQEDTSSPDAVDAPVSIADAPIDPPPENKTRKPKRLVLAILGTVAAVLVAAVICVLHHFSCYDHAQELSAEGLFSEAQDSLFLPSLTPLHDPQFVDYLEAGVRLTEGDYSGARTRLETLPSDYRNCGEMLLALDYHDAQLLLNLADYDAARALLEPLADIGYLDSQSLLFSIDYIQGCTALEQGNLAGAMRYLEPLAQANYQDSKSRYQEATLAYAWERIGNTEALLSVQAGLDYMDELLREGYAPAETARNEAYETIYQYAISLYENAQHYDARSYFELLENYSRAKDYLTLCDACDMTASLEDLWALRGFANADTLLLTQEYLCRFLVGSWLTGNGSYYCNMESWSSGQYDYYCTYNLPWQYNGDFVIEDGIYRVMHNGGAPRNEFRFSIHSWNEISVYCYKNNKTYTLYRQ